MAGETNILERVRESAARKVLFLPHAICQMSRLDRQISSEEVLAVIQGGELAEDYPEDARGHSCLLLGYGEAGRAIHVVCSPKEDYLAIITAYLPDPQMWQSDHRTRKQQ